jgi:hypothetical protein
LQDIQKAAIKFAGKNDLFLIGTLFAARPEHKYIPTMNHFLFPTPFMRVVARGITGSKRARGGVRKSKPL